MRQFALLLLSVAVAHASVTVSRTSNDGPHPSSMEIEVTLPDSTKILVPLTRTDAFEDIPMTLVENGVSRTFSSRQVHLPSHAHYRNIDTRAVVSVRHVNGKRQISGHVMHEGTSYFMEPFGDSEHRVTKNQMNPEAMAKQIDLNKIKLQRRKRQTNLAATTNVVELYLLIDSTVWAAFVQIFGTEAAALPELHLYYTNILNGIDTTYRNLQSISISVSCIGMTIAKTSADDTWMTGNTEASPILAKIASFIVGQPPADHYMGFTRLDLTDGGSPSVCGMAYVSSTCTPNRVSINEDQGLHCWGTAAHELGHNLGSQHDSTGNTCSPSTKNIMAPSTNFYSIADVANSYRFSSCSETYISQYVAGLTSKGNNCLQSAQGSRLPVLKSTDREGTRLTLDQVCKLSYPSGPGKFFLSSDVVAAPAKICTGIFCATSAGGGTASGGLRAPVGTPCGNQKSCNWNGECAPDSAAPVADDTCFWGDSWSASNCASWKDYIVKGWTSCTADVKKGCCRSVGTLSQCAGV